MWRQHHYTFCGKLVLNNIQYEWHIQLSETNERCHIVQCIVASTLHFIPQPRRLVYYKHLAKCSQMVQSWQTPLSQPNTFWQAESFIWEGLNFTWTPAPADRRKYFQYIMWKVNWEGIQYVFETLSVSLPLSFSLRFTPPLSPFLSLNKLLKKKKMCFQLGAEGKRATFNCEHYKKSLW